MGWQLTKLFNDSGVFTPGVSKHELKDKARAEGSKTWHEIGKKLTICSYETARTYKDVWHRFGNWAKAELGLKDIEKTTADHVRAFLESRMEEGIQWSTFTKEKAALEKLEVALNLYAAKFNTGKSYNFSPSLKEVSRQAREELQKGKNETRAYADPAKLVNSLKSQAHQIKALLQLEGGARISETYLKPNQLKGINEYGQGVIRLMPYNAKGGRERDICLTAATYEMLRAHIDREGEFSINDKAYGAALQKAASVSGQPYYGPHGLRWTFAQNRMHALQKLGFTYEHSLFVVSSEMGHSRADITERYLK